MQADYLKATPGTSVSYSQREFSISQCNTNITSIDLATVAGYSNFDFHRLFHCCPHRIIISKINKNE